MDKIGSPLILLFFCASVPALSQTARPCPRYTTGSAITAPQDIYSSAGVLTVNLIYQTSVDQYGNQLFCFLTPDGAQS
ncbi:MAG TPA: hypothetical protein VHW09_24540, partial [Bryobacteraceae bacterium]|nr:hypothetical protein [Bryobacteraceae bacterium]